MRPYFQPIVSASASNPIVGVEALLRVPHGEIECGSLFKRLEATGEVVDVDAAMVRRVATVLRTCGVAPGMVGVNVSALTLALAPDAYLREVGHLAACAHQVIVEVTETFPVLDADALAYFSRQCRRLGVYIAFDDCTPQHPFCTADMVHKVQPKIIKIDGPLFDAGFRASCSDAVVEVMGYAKAVNATVVAEHVESRAMRDWACSLGVGLLQGFYFGRAEPLPACSTLDASNTVSP